jgi:hypothetical protein
MPDLIESHQSLATADILPKKILSSEIIRAKPSLMALGIGFSVSYAKKRMKAGKPKKLPILLVVTTWETWETSIS